MDSLKRIAGAGGSDLFGTGTYKTSDATLNLDGTPKKINAVIAQSGFTITSMKYRNSLGDEVTSALKLLTTALTDGTLVTFDYAVHEIIIVGTAMFYFE